jgi:Ribonuclease E/G family
LAEWLYEDAIGEQRAALIDNGQIVEAILEPYGDKMRVGAQHPAAVKKILVPGKRIIVEREAGLGLLTGDAGEVLIENIPPRFDQHRPFHIEITREAMFDGRKHKRAKGRILDIGELSTPMPGQIDQSVLIERLKATDTPVRIIGPYDPDVFEDFGWSTMIDEAQNSEVEFPGGSISISFTPAMTLIDVDGWIDAEPLARAAAVVVGRSIRRFGLGGSIGIDFPTLKGKVARQEVAHLLLANLPLPCEHTGLNGFGFMQIVRPRPRASLIEVLYAHPVARAACALLRQTQRSGLVGPVTLVLNQAMADYLDDGIPSPEGLCPDRTHKSFMLERLSRIVGGPVTLQIIPGLAMHAAYATQTV